LPLDYPAARPRLAWCTLQSGVSPNQVPGMRKEGTQSMTFSKIASLRRKR
jgi:hypothetical protein